MAKSNLLFLSSVLVLLSSCLHNESSCTYFRLTEKELYDHTWHVDSFTIEIKDSVGNFYFDTTYINDGIWEFVPGGTSDMCAREGHIKLTRSNGEIETLNYHYSSYVPGTYDVLCLSAPHSIDPINEAYEECMCYRLGDKLRIKGLSNFGCSEYYNPTTRKRQWKFVLSKQ